MADERKGAVWEVKAAVAFRWDKGRVAFGSGNNHLDSYYVERVIEDVEEFARDFQLDVSGRFGGTAIHAGLKNCTKPNSPRVVVELMADNSRVVTGQIDFDIDVEADTEALAYEKLQAALTRKARQACSTCVADLIF